MKRVYIVTGSGSGIGLMLTTELVASGDIVYGVDLAPHAELKAHQITADVRDYNLLGKEFKKIREREGRIDGIIHCAGIGVSGAVEFSDASELSETLAVNLAAVVELSKLALPYLRESKGKILALSSVAGIFPIPFQTYYSLSKAALISFCDALRNEVRPLGVDVCAVVPGDVKTPFTQHRRQPVSKKNLYSQRARRSIDRMARDEAAGMMPQEVTKVIRKLLNKPHLPARKIIGAKYKFLVFLDRVLPKRLAGWIIYKMYGE